MKGECIVKGTIKRPFSPETNGAETARRLSIEGKRRKRSGNLTGHENDDEIEALTVSGH